MGVEQAERDTMNRPPYSPQEGVFSRGAGKQTIWVGLMIGALGLGIGSLYYFSGRAEWQTMIFTTLAFAQIGQALASRSNRESLFRLGLMSNPLLLGMSALVLALQLMVLYIPPIAQFFSVTPLALADLLVALGSGVLVFAVIEISKRFNK
jgi:Ca2+-transporting ATPase